MLQNIELSVAMLGGSLDSKGNQHEEWHAMVITRAFHIHFMTLHIQ